MTVANVYEDKYVSKVILLNSIQLENTVCAKNADRAPKKRQRSALFGKEERPRNGRDFSASRKASKCRELRRSGCDGEKDTPVPIPNTVVKLLSAENTWRATAREHRTLPEQRAYITM